MHYRSNIFLSFGRLQFSLDHSPPQIDCSRLIGLVLCFVRVSMSVCVDSVVEVMCHQEAVLAVISSMWQ